jgi:pimeloyl-ACP methyl ester carboxylesterase
MTPSYSWLWALLPVPLIAYILTRPTPGVAVTLTGLHTAPFPAAHGEAFVYVPEGLLRGPVEVVVYLHGWNACLANVVGSTPAACPPETTVHAPYDILGQFERSGRRAALIVPQLRYDAAAGDPGQFATQGGFAAFLREVQERMGMGPIDGVTLYAHSGGYQAAAAILNRGGVGIKGVVLLDALYGNVDTFARFAPIGKFVSLYTAGTAANNQTLAAQVDAVTTLPWNGRPVVARADVSHGQVPGYMESLLRSV